MKTAKAARRAGWAGVLITAVLVLSLVPMGASVTQGKKKLSKSDIVTFYTPGSSNSYPQWIAEADGTFKKNGLNVTLKPISTSLQDVIAGLLSGSIDYACSGGVPYLSAMQNGAPLKAFAVAGTGNDYQLVINKNSPEAKNIPATGTPTQQIAGIKGSKLDFASNSLQSTPNLELVRQLKEAGLVEGTDYTTSNAGSLPNMVAAYTANQTDGISSSVGATYNVPLANSIRINYSDMPGYVSDRPNLICYATADTLENHPDTTLAFAKSYLAGYNQVVNDPEKAEKLLIPMFEEGGITDPTLRGIVFDVNQQMFPGSKGTQLSKKLWDAAIEYGNVNNSAITPKPPTLALDYATYVDPSFMKKATKASG